MLDVIRAQPGWLLNVLDVLIVAFIVYRGLLVIKGTRAVPMLWGLILIVLLYFVARFGGLNTLTWILGSFLSSIILVVVVIFQDEIRRGLTKVGTHRLFTAGGKSGLEKTVEDIILVVERLAAEKLGALIVLQRRVGLDEFVEEAVVLDALLNRKLLYSIFLKQSPLHDGAVLVDGERIKAAGCVLPLSSNPDLDPSLGTRHRAAMGLSERSDALIIAVSEQNGSISCVRDGKLSRNLDLARLRELMWNSLTGGSELLKPEERVND